MRRLTLEIVLGLGLGLYGDNARDLSWEKNRAKFNNCEW